jgi:hypothetical protein
MYPIVEEESERFTENWQKKLAGRRQPCSGASISSFQSPNRWVDKITNPKNLYLAFAREGIKYPWKKIDFQSLRVEKLLNLRRGVLALPGGGVLGVGGVQGRGGWGRGKEEVGGGRVRGRGRSRKGAF